MSYNGEGGPPLTPVPVGEPSNDDLTTGEIFKEPARYAKALMSAGVSAAGAAAVAASGGFTPEELWGILGIAVAAFAAVFGVRNKGA